MSFIKYSDAIREKINSYGVVILKKEIKYDDGLFPVGSRVIPELCSYNQEESTCDLFLCEYNSTGCSEVRNFIISTDKLDDYFMPDTKLQELRALSNEIFKKREKITDALENALSINLILSVVSLLFYVVSIIEAVSLIPFAVLLLEFFGVCIVVLNIMRLIFKYRYLVKQKEQVKKDIDDYLNKK